MENVNFYGIFWLFKELFFGSRGVMKKLGANELFWNLLLKLLKLLREFRWKYCYFVEFWIKYITIILENSAGTERHKTLWWQIISEHTKLCHQLYKTVTQLKQLLPLSCCLRANVPCPFKFSSDVPKILVCSLCVFREWLRIGDDRTLDVNWNWK